MNIQNKEILDAGSGANPFPQATILCDLYIGPTNHRRNKLAKIDERPFVCCSIEHLPFSTKSFNLVYSWHVLEHTDNPKLALSELKRVGKHGYIVFPSLFKEMFLSSNFICHKWVIDPNEQNSKPIKNRLKAFRRITTLLWQFNAHIRFREHFLKRITRRSFDNSIRW